MMGLPLPRQRLALFGPLVEARRAKLRAGRRGRTMGLFPPSMGKALAPQGPTGSAPGALLLVNIAYYGGGD